MHNQNKKISNKFNSRLNKGEYSREMFIQTSYDLKDHQKLKKNKSKDKSAKSLLNFISTKKIILKSCFDHKGAKKFLAEKSKAMEEFILFDEISDYNDNNNIVYCSNNKKKSHIKIIKSHKNIKFYQSYKPINHSNLMKINHKKNNYLSLYENENKSSINSKKVKISAKSLPKQSIKDIKDIGKIDQKVFKKKLSKFDSIKSKYSNINQNDRSYLITGDNDSLILSIINEMTNIIN